MSKHLSAKLPVNNDKTTIKIAAAGPPPKKNAPAQGQPRLAEMPEIDLAGPAVKDEKADPAPDPFDPESLRLDGDFDLGAKPVLTVVEVRKPPKSAFVRTHPDPSYRMPVATVEVETGGRRQLYFVERKLLPHLPAFNITATSKLLVTSITAQGLLFLWELNLPKAEGDGRGRAWTESAMAAVELAHTKWVRVSASMDEGRYLTFEAEGNLPDPVWPDEPFTDILKLAVKGRYISDLSHEVIDQLRGKKV
jgi:hypothetical protein